MTLRNCLLAICAAPSILWGAQPQNTFEKQVVFPAGATAEQKIDMASRLAPSPRQLQWQRMELTAFLHFGINTFTGREWGDGTESPALFNPCQLDAEQWIRTLSDAGFKMVILTAKHHDGFCLWPTATTAHSVKSSPWRDGKGDVMAELRRACDKYGMKLGVYLSPWDRNAACYGDSPRYNDMFVAQLTELLTGYGRIDEVWFDGACGEGPNGKKQQYDWERYRRTIQRLQPEAVMAIMGDDVRWVGNEKGMGRENEWSATALTPGIYPESAQNNSRLGISAKAPDLGSRDLVARADRLYWWPSEVDVSIRPGWFYHDTEQPRPLRNLTEIYLNSVGRNSVLLLNVPPDQRGLIAEADAARLKELRTWLDTNLKPLPASPIDRHDFSISLEPAVGVNAVTISEDITRGQHVEEFEVDALVDGLWRKVSQGTTIGLKRILVFPEVQAAALRVRPLSARGQTNIDNIEAHHIALPADTGAELPGYRAMPATDWHVLACSGNRPTVYRAFDGSDATYWQSEESDRENSITVDTRRTAPVAGFVYTPRSGDDNSGTVYHYRFELSADGEHWQNCTASGEFSNIAYNPLPQMVYFPAPVEARYFRFTALDEIGGRPYMTVGELQLLVADSDSGNHGQETALWRNPSAPLTLLPGSPHPTAKGWKFHTAHEFNSPDLTVGVPAGWVLHNGPHVARAARIDAARFVTVGGYLRMSSRREEQPIDNGHGVTVEHTSYACRSARPGEDGFWCNFTENMRIEVRARRSSTTGINDALWFMGNNSRPWPDNGEIDLLENPKKTINNRAHFTLHSKNHYAGVVGGGGSTTASVEVADMTDWNIYWMEWLPDCIRGGVNGITYFEHHRGQDGNNDWPWNDPEGFYMLMTSGLSVNPDAWPGSVDSENWDADNLPHLDVDWVRVFVNDSFSGPPAERKYY